MKIDQRYRIYFPIFEKQKKIVYLDSAATSFKPNLVIKSVNDYYQLYTINSHSINDNLLSKKVEKTIENCRKLIAKKIKIENPEEVVFFPSATYALNVLALSCENYLSENSKIALTYLEHSSNLYPWQSIIQKKRAKVNYLPLNKNFSIDIKKIKKNLDSSTKIASFFHVSNSLGSINKVKKITKMIKSISPDCLVIIDACQSISHLPININSWGIDALVFSGHKVYGPTGIGVLWIKKELGQKFPDLLWGGGKKSNPKNSEKDLLLSTKFEVGTLPLAEIFGLKAAFEFLNKINLRSNYKYENNLHNYALEKLSKIKNLVIYSQKSATSIITFNLNPYHAHDIANYLSKKSIYLRAGDFCCPYLDKIINVNSSLRISLGIYNNYEDIDKLVKYLKKINKKPQILLPF